MASSWLRLASIVGPAVIGVLLTVGTVRHVYIFLSLTAVVGAVGAFLLRVETKRIRRQGSTVTSLS